jgi:hypothetical protein
MAHEPSGRLSRSGLRNPFQEAAATAHSLASCLWERTNVGIAESVAVPVAERYGVNPWADPLMNPRNRAPTPRGWRRRRPPISLALPDASEYAEQDPGGHDGAKACAGTCGSRPRAC